MNSESILAWSLRLVTIAAVLVPLVFYYLASGSVWNFLLPSLNTPSSLMSFNPNSIRITSIDYSVVGDAYLLSIGVRNTGSMRIGLKEADIAVSVPRLNMRLRLLLQSPFTLEPGEEERVSIRLLLESGNLEDLHALLSQRTPVDVSGRAILILNSAELPLNLSITDLPIGPWPSW